MKKRKSHAFGKDVYLLGADENGELYWLEAPSWDCGWYWGFGYIETYKDNWRPDRAKDIDSHQHAGRFYGEWWRPLGDNKSILTETTFEEGEGWELSELFAQFYFLKEAAEMFGRGKANIAGACVPLWKDPKKVEEINQVLIPAVTARIIEILTPKK